MEARLSATSLLLLLMLFGDGYIPGDAAFSGSGQSKLHQAAGGPISLRCNISPGGQVLWYKQESGAKMEFARDGHLSISDSRYQITSNNGAYYLQINPAHDSDSGTYICESTSQDGSLYTHTFQVKIGEGGGAGQLAAATFGTIISAVVLLRAL